MRANMSHPPTPIRRPRGPLLWFFRFPVLIYRLGLGPLMGGQLLLTTVGRRTGRPRRAGVDVMRHDPDTDTYYVMSGWGTRADWYRNLQADPALTVQVGRRTFPARATPLPEPEAADLTVDFVRRHRRYARIMLRLIGAKVGPSEDDIRSLASQIVILAIRPQPAQAPGPA